MNLWDGRQWYPASVVDVWELGTRVLAHLQLEAQVREVRHALGQVAS